MKIPKEVRFMSSTYKVLTPEGFSDNRSGDNLQGNLGSISYRRGEIKLDPDVNNSGEVFFHEITHMITHHMSIEMDEKDVERFGEGLFHFLTENKLLK